MRPYSITFFAPPNRALRAPHRKPEGRLPIFFSTEASEALAVPYLSHTCDLGEAISALEFLEASTTPSDKDHDRHKGIFKTIIRALLAYHILPDSNDVVSLGRNTTFSTNLTIPGAQGGNPLRLRVEQTLLPPMTTLNLFTKVVRPNVKASNGRLGLSRLV